MQNATRQLHFLSWYRTASIQGSWFIAIISRGGSRFFFETFIFYRPCNIIHFELFLTKYFLRTFEDNISVLHVKTLSISNSHKKLFLAKMNNSLMSLLSACMFRDTHIRVRFWNVDSYDSSPADILKGRTILCSTGCPKKCIRIWITPAIWI